MYSFHYFLRGLDNTVCVNIAYLVSFFLNSTGMKKDEMLICHPRRIWTHGL